MLQMNAISPQLDIVRAEATRWLGDWHPLVRQIAPGEGVTTVTASLTAHDCARTSDLDTLRDSLLSYKTDVLLKHELQVMLGAHGHALRNETRELLELDLRLAGEDWMQPMREGSRQAGRAHLERLRPLRDQRQVRRYAMAVDAGEAHGWHMVVAGLALGVYAIPLRQGLLDYPVHTLLNALGKGAAALRLRAEDCRGLAIELLEDLPQLVQPLIRSGSPICV